MNKPGMEQGSSAKGSRPPETDPDEFGVLALGDERAHAQDADIRAWWQRSPPAAAAAALAIGGATLWFGNMLSRVPLDQHATFGYLLMFPLLLIVPAFSLAGLRLAWTAYANRPTGARVPIVIVSLTAALCNLAAILRFCGALVRIFSA